MVCCVRENVGNTGWEGCLWEGRKDGRNETDARCEKDSVKSPGNMYWKWEGANLLFIQLFLPFNFPVSLYWKYYINVYILEDDDAEVNRNGKNITSSFRSLPGHVKGRKGKKQPENRDERWSGKYESWFNSFLILSTLPTSFHDTHLWAHQQFHQCSPSFLPPFPPWQQHSTVLWPGEEEDERVISEWEFFKSMTNFGIHFPVSLNHLLLFSSIIICNHSGNLVCSRIERRVMIQKIISIPNKRFIAPLKITCN